MGRDGGPNDRVRQRFMPAWRVVPLSVPAEAPAKAQVEIKKKLGKRPCPLSHSPLSQKQFRLDIVYGLLGHPELGQDKLRRKVGRPPKESTAVGKTNKRVMTTPDRQARRATAQRFSTASKRRRPNPPSGKTHSYPTVRLDRLDPDRFIVIKNLHRHRAWDFQDKKKGAYGSNATAARFAAPLERYGMANIGAAL